MSFFSFDHRCLPKKQSNKLTQYPIPRHSFHFISSYTSICVPILRTMSTANLLWLYGEISNILQQQRILSDHLRRLDKETPENRSENSAILTKIITFLDRLMSLYVWFKSPNIVPHDLFIEYSWAFSVSARDARDTVYENMTSLWGTDALGPKEGEKTNDILKGVDEAYEGLIATADILLEVCQPGYVPDSYIAFTSCYDTGAFSAPFFHDVLYLIMGEIKEKSLTHV
jgi:hypothetical protein